jgi:hypothetical protein
VCAVLQTGDDQVLTHGMTIRVVDKPDRGSTWRTVSGRELRLNADGALWASGGDVTENPRARAAQTGVGWLDDLIGLFTGRSRTLNAVAGQGAGEARAGGKAETTYTTGGLTTAQLTLDGKLDSDPKPPAAVNGPCLGTNGATVYTSTCPQLATQGGTAALGLAGTGGRLVAAGGGNVMGHKGGALIGPDGASLIGPDGASLIGPDGASLIGADGASLIGADGATAIAPDIARMVAGGAGSLTPDVAAGLIGPDGAS